MEGEKKRKRAEDDQVGGGRRKEMREVEAEGEAMPTDEEVDEFFAILRRMQVAVKYFKKGGRNAAAGRKWTGRWATELEAEVLAGVNGGKAAEERSACGVQKKNGALDLNAVPEAESNSMGFSFSLFVRAKFLLINE
ncbi:protein NIM1-INTERACTING 2-like [Rhododendron vialii]|uniref:protein NIM1-INTERACTING 2-like n=1 Tax=Rhododendron vialii TaxID=182163 RepID=UPI00265E28C4|nr:protein NIM1-INTERACTING 2-like [Rhododendron vialii]